MADATTTNEHHEASISTDGHSTPSIAMPRERGQRTASVADSPCQWRLRYAPSRSALAGNKACSSYTIVPWLPHVFFRHAAPLIAATSVLCIELSTSADVIHIHCPKLDCWIGTADSKADRQWWLYNRVGLGS